jgi:hypothetical protein
VDHFRRKTDDKEARERYITDSYTKLSTQWMKKVERVENSRKRKDRDAKARELYEKVFDELRKQRENKERDHRLGTRGAVRSEADIEDVIERLQEQEVSYNYFIFLLIALSSLKARPLQPLQAPSGFNSQKGENKHSRPIITIQEQLML